MNIAFVIGSFVPDHVGGTEIQAAELARRLADRHGVSVLTRRTGTGGTLHDRLGGASVYRHAIPPRARGRSLRALIAKRRTLSSIAPRPGVLVCYHIADAGVLGRFLSLGSGLPYVVWLRSEIEIDRTSHLAGRLLARVALGRAALVLTQTAGLRRKLLETLARNRLGRLADRLEPRTEVLGNAVELGPEIASPLHPAATSDAGAERTVLFAGRLYEDKGLDDLLVAVRSIAGARLVIAGEGPERARLDSAVAGDPAIEIKGLLPRQDLLAEMRRACVLCLPSWHEGLPNVVLEAQACGLPVVATRVGGLPEAIVDGASGLLVPPRDPSALARALARVLGDRALREALARGGREAVRLHSWDALLPRFERLLETVVARSDAS